MESLVAKATRLARKEYESQLETIRTNTTFLDILRAANRFWCDLTGTPGEIMFHRGQPRLDIHMGTLKSNGKYPSRAYDLVLLQEFIDERLEGTLDFEHFYLSVDASSTDLRWGRRRYEPVVTIYAYHGGNCTYKQVGVKTFEQPIYETECK